MTTPSADTVALLVLYSILGAGCTEERLRTIGFNAHLNPEHTEEWIAAFGRDNVDGLMASSERLLERHSSEGFTIPCTLLRNLLLGMGFDLSAQSRRNATIAIIGTYLRSAKPFEISEARHLAEQFVNAHMLAEAA